MKRASLLLFAAALAVAQDEGGRDTGTGPRPVVFVRARRTAESGEIYNAAWRALESHFGVVSRRRLADFDGDPKRAEAFFAENGDAVLVVAFGPEVLRFVPAGKPLLRVGEEGDAHVLARTDRARLAQAIRAFRPGSRTVALFGDADETLPGLHVRRCDRPEAAAGCDVAWLPEGSGRNPRELRKALDPLGLPLVSTGADVDAGIAALSVRPDPHGLGLKVAAAMLLWAREGRPFEPTTVLRHRTVIDLVAARAAGHEVPLGALAKADVVRRGP